MGGYKVVANVVSLRRAAKTSQGTAGVEPCIIGEKVTGGDSVDQDLLAF